MRFCPVCKVVLVNTLRDDVEVDYCPKCQGVWLDRHELNKIIDRVIQRQTARVSAAGMAHHPEAQRQQNVPHHIIQHYPPVHRNAADLYLEDLFDFDD